jgi:excisionase family DNA binding protein
MKTHYLNIAKASEYLSLAKASLYAYTSKKMIPHIKLAGKLLFDKKDLDDWLQSKKQEVK